MPTVEAKSDEAWRAEEDFRTLTNAEEVLADKRRLSRAKRAGRTLVSKEKKALARKEKVAGGGKRTARKAKR